MPHISAERDALLHKTWTLMLRILAIFGIPAMMAYFIGEYIDTRFGIKPQGTLWALLVSFIVSWAITIREYKKISREFRMLDEKEAQEQAERQSQLQQNVSQKNQPINK